MHLLITMAGAGTRFKKAGESRPKYAITVHERTLLEWSLLSLLQFSEFPVIFIARPEGNNGNPESFIKPIAQRLGFASTRVLTLDKHTEGQASTVLAAKQALPTVSSPILIYNIDTFVEPAFLSPQMIQGAGWVPAFAAAGEHWSFVRFDEALRVTDIAEKQRISDFATIGLYYFSSFTLFESSYHRKNSQPLITERYVAPLYQSLLKSAESPVFTTLIPPERVHVMGTPAELEAFGVLDPSSLTCTV